MKKHSLVCKCGGKIQMVKVSHIEQIYDYKDNCFHQHDSDGYEEIYFKCQECNNKYNVEFENCEIISTNVEKLYIKGNNNYTDIGSELTFGELQSKLRNNKN